MLMIVLAVWAGAVVGYCQTESFASLDERLEEYFDAIKREGIEVQKAECDFLIETCTDPVIKQHVAQTVYDHYRDSKIMGAEAVAIHIFDKWFASEELKMRDDMELFTAKIFAEFNRQSLIGQQAPELQMYDASGELHTLFGEKAPGRFSVLYFYDTSCATCKLQTLQLTRLLRDETFPIDLYAVYASDDSKAWADYVSDRFSGQYDGVRIYHLWDSQMDSDFQRKYGVLQTPRMFLISPDGTIVGRGLDVPALSQLLHSIFDEVELEYGSEASMDLFDSIFAIGNPSKDDVCQIVDYIAAATMEKGDTVMFRQMSGDLLYYMALQRGEGFKEGLDYLADNYILTRSDVWKSADDSLKVIGMAEMYDDLLSKSTPGKLVPDMKLPGTLLTSKKIKNGNFKLRKLGGERNVIMFVTDGCNVCAAEKKAASAMVKEDKDLKVLMVNVDELLAASPSLSSRLFDSFDLSTLPFILETDSDGRIVRRYITFIEVEK